jgi:hypothetical protein
MTMNRIVLPCIFSSFALRFDRRQLLVTPYSRLPPAEIDRYDKKYFGGQKHLTFEALGMAAPGSAGGCRWI